MPVNRIPDFMEEMIEMIDAARRRSGIEPIFLGGVAGPNGGSGEPPGGFIGQLTQSNVAYDQTEAATLSGISSLLDNLNHIRYRLGGGSGLNNDELIERIFWGW